MVGRWSGKLPKCKEMMLRKKEKRGKRGRYLIKPVAKHWRLNTPSVQLVVDESPVDGKLEARRKGVVTNRGIDTENTDEIGKIPVVNVERVAARRVEHYSHRRTVPIILVVVVVVLFLQKLRHLFFVGKFTNRPVIGVTFL